MKRIFLYLMILVIMVISIGGCFWWDPWDRGGGRGGGERRGGGEGHGGRH